MTEVEFKRLAAQGFNRIPVVLETFADLDTPLSIYLKLANKPYSYLLESVQGGERFGRYSFIGLAVVHAHQCAGRRRCWCCRAIASPSAPTQAIRWRSSTPISSASRWRPCPACRVSAAGWSAASATTRCAISSRASRIPRTPDTLGTPDILLMLSEEVAIVDNLSGKLTLVVYAEPEVPGAYQKARARLRELLAALRAPAQIPAEAPHAGETAAFGVRRSRHTRRRWSAPSVTSTTATSCRWCCRSACRCRSQPSRWRCTGRCARSILRPTCSISISRTSTWSAPRPKSWCGWRATR